MGQYHLIVNLDRGEYLHPRAFGDGLKLGEFGGSSQATMLGLAALLARDNGKGGGDLEPHPLVGRWAGQRIVIAGDYGAPLDMLPADWKNHMAAADPKGEHEQPNLHTFAQLVFHNISPLVATYVAWERGESASVEMHDAARDVVARWKREGTFANQEKKVAAAPLPDSPFTVPE